jgi:hypothetical protein
MDADKTFNPLENKENCVIKINSVINVSKKLKKQRENSLSQIIFELYNKNSLSDE